MPYLFDWILLPTLIAGLILSCIDIASRRVPLLLVALAYVTQVGAFLLLSGPSVRVMEAVVISLVSASVQWILALIRPGSLGVGDVTATALMTLIPGWFGWTSVVFWWLILGLLGLMGLGGLLLVSTIRSIYRKHNNHKRLARERVLKDKNLTLPYVPFISAAALIILFLPV